MSAIHRLNIGSKFSNRPPTGSPYGGTVVPLKSEYIAKNGDVFKSQDLARIRDVAMAGTNEEANDVLRGYHNDGADRLDRLCQEHGREMGNLLVGLGEIDVVETEVRFADAEASVIKISHLHEEDVLAAKADEIKHRHALNFIKATHGIRREVTNPFILLTGGLMLLFGSVEFTSGLLLYWSVEQDLSQAVLMAFLIVLGMSGTAFLTGFLALRYAVNSARTGFRAAGITGVLLGFFMMFYLALLVAHDRDHLATFDPDVDFIRRFDWALIFHPTEWFHFETLQGLGFLVILMVFGSLSIWKSYGGFSDPIPGYSERVENWRHAANNVNDRVRQHREAISAPLEREAALLDQQLEGDRTILQRANKLLDEGRHCETRYYGSANVVVGLVNSAITKVQDAYLEIRPQRPAFFDQFLTIKNVPSLPVTTAMLEAKVRDIQTIATRNRENATHLKLRLNKLFIQTDRELQAYLSNLEELGTKRFHQERQTDAGRA